MYVYAATFSPLNLYARCVIIPPPLFTTLRAGDFPTPIDRRTTNVRHTAKYVIRQLLIESSLRLSSAHSVINLHSRLFLEGEFH